MEDATTEFTSVKLDIFYGLRLSTLSSTKIFQKEVNVDWNIYDFCQKQKHDVAHLLIQLNLINILYVLTRTVARK